MSGIGFICTLLFFYELILVARVILSWVQMFRPGWSPPTGLRPVLDFVYAMTDPPVNYLRRFIPPLQSGGIALDLAFIVWFFFIVIMRRVLGC